jgi:glucosamine kinase
MKLIADSGSTTTSWHLFADSSNVQTDCKTSGINPFFQQSSQIVKTLEEEFQLPLHEITSVWFYGAGAANEAKKQELYTALHAYFNVDTIIIESDLLAAAHSLCGTQPGIAAIMGTGSNSCYYDGARIAQHVSPLGYILGDEGSGAVLGKKLLSDVLKNQLPEHIINQFYESYQLTPADIIESVYRKPYPNRYMAGFTKFLSANIHQEAIFNIVFSSFTEFFTRNIKQYKMAESFPVHFTGSIAWYFKDILQQAAATSGFKIGLVTRNPMEGLIEYHRQLPE